MIALQAEDNEFFDLPGKTKLDITGSNPAFDKDAVARVFSYPFKMPASARNLRILQHINRLDAKRVGEDKTARATTLWIGGSPFKSGFLTVGDVTKDDMECTFGNLERKVLDMLDDIKIKSLMPTVDIPQVVQGHWYFDINPVTSPYEYRVLINDVSYLYLADPGDDEFDAGTALRDLINADWPGTTIVSGGDPVLEIRAGTNDPFVVSTYSGLTLTEALTVGEAAQANLLTYLDDLLDTPVDSHGFPMLRHNGFYGATNFLFSSWVNYYIDGVRGENEPSSEQEWKYTYVPYVKVKYVFDRIAEQLGIVWAGDFYESTDFAQLHLFSNYSLDKIRYEYFSVIHKYFNGFKISFDLKNHVPDQTAKAFLQLYFDLFSIYPDIDGTTIYLKKRREQFNSKPIDFSKNIIADYKMSVTPTKGVTLKYVGADAIQTVNPGQLDDYAIGDGGLVLEFRLYPLADSFFADPVSVTTVRCAWINEIGSSDELGIGINSAGVRIFFDRGLQMSLTGVEHSMTTHLDTDMAGTVIGELSLEWDGDNGLYEQHWKGWAELQDKPPVELSAVVPVSVAQDLLRWQRPIIRFYHPMGESSFIIKDLDFDVSKDTGEFILVSMNTIKI